MSDTEYDTSIETYNINSEEQDDALYINMPYSSVKIKSISKMIESKKFNICCVKKFLQSIIYNN